MKIIDTLYTGVVVDLGDGEETISRDYLRQLKRIMLSATHQEIWEAIRMSEDADNKYRGLGGRPPSY